MGKKEKKGKEEYETLLPDDEELIERSIIWGTMFEKYVDTDECEHEHLVVHSINTGNNDESDESVDPLIFETNEKDSDFDVQDTLNKTKKYVDKRKEEWHCSGLDQIMDTFNLNKIQNKVGNWLTNDSNLFFNTSLNKTSFPQLFINQKVEIQNHKFYSDKDSVDSVDTAKYILSSRKKTFKSLHNKVTTMTIKRYCYSNRKRINEIEQQPNNVHLYDRKKNALESCSNHNRPNNSFESNSNNCCRRKTNKKSNKATDTSISSSTTKNVSDNECKILSDNDGKSKKKIGSLSKTPRKISRKSSKSRNMFHANAKENYESSSSSETNLSDRRKKPSKKSKSENLFKNQTISRNLTSQSEINFNENNFINSTAIEKSKAKNDKQKNNLVPVIEIIDSSEETEKCNDNKKDTILKNVNCTPIVLYEPDSKLVSKAAEKKIMASRKKIMDNTLKNVNCTPIVLYEPDSKLVSKAAEKKIMAPRKKIMDNTLKNVNCTPIVLYEPDNSKFVSKTGEEKIMVTRKLLMDKIGEDLTDKCLNGEKEIVHEFDSSSKIIFYPPENDNDDSSNSDESDFFEKLYKNKARLVEVVNFNS